MKRILVSLILVTVFILSFSFTYAVDVRINFGIINLPVEPVIYNDRTLVPLRVLAEIFGADVEWDPKGVVTINYRNDEIVLPINSKRVIVNNDVLKIDSPAIIVNSYTMVPLKFLSDYFDVEVEWHEQSQMVNVIINDEKIIARVEEVSRNYSRKSIYEGYKVVIDAGHGGSETGAYYGGVAEKNINLAIAKYVEDLLKKYDIKVYMTRSEDVTTTLDSRTSLANNIRADLFISIHSNAIVGKPYISGTELLYKSNSLVKNGVTNSILATNLQNNVTQIAGTYSRGLINRTNLYVLNRTTMPAALVEVGYMTNSSELYNLNSDAFRRKAAEGITEGILKTLKVMINN